MMRYFYIVIFLCCIVIISGTIAVGSRFAAGVSLEYQVSVWDLVFKAVAGLITLIGASFTIIQYLENRSKILETAFIEARKPFFNKQQEIYSDLLIATATVSTIENFDDLVSVEAERQFWIIYWGELPMVTDDAVAVVADRFAELLAPHSEDWIALRNTSMDLSRACRTSLRFEAPLLQAKGNVTTWVDARPGL